MEIRDVANPVGEVHLDEAIENYIQVIIGEWEESKEESAPWWKFWQRFSFVRVTDFLLRSLDNLIAYVDQVLDLGEDKKATVMEAISRIYDFIVREAMPIWFTPFASAIKTIILEEVISPAIDWIVAKYREGSWTRPPAEELANQWKMKAQMFGVPGGHRPK